MKFNTLYSGYYPDNGYPFDALADKVEHAQEPHDLQDDNSALVIWGGSDINPSLYNHPKGRRTSCYEGRDESEWALMQEAIRKGMTIIGVCRGAQMACAAAGGYLLQHVENHSGYHDVVTPDGKTISVNSIHHQMMAGYEKVGHELLGWIPQRRSPHYLYKADELFPVPEQWVEPEYIYFKDIKAHAIQWHPEMMKRTSEATAYVLQSIKER